MCGIVGYIGVQPAAPILLDGLGQLEYRGYDSAGLAVIGADGGLQIRRAAGKLAHLRQLVAQRPVTGVVGIGHTRWATHGPPTQYNAHPHQGGDGGLVVVQNGIVENFLALRQRLSALGYHFASDTDTEVIAHLVDYHYYNGCSRDLLAAVRCTLAELSGPSALVVLCREQPDRLVAARLGNAGGLAIGYGAGEMWLASDLPALLPHTREVVFLADGEMALITPAGATFQNLAGDAVAKTTTTIAWEAATAQKGEYEHFMLKEIFEQPRALRATLHGRLDLARQQVTLDTLNLTPPAIAALEKITIVACGTSHCAALVGKFLIERLARLPVEVDYASEFRYRQPIIHPRQLVVAITQSGETVDTLAALEEAQAGGARTVAIVNAVGSQAARSADGVIYMEAGPEIGVASTKAFTASLVDLVLLALYLGQGRQTLDAQTRHELCHAFYALPEQAEWLLDDLRRHKRCAELAERYGQFNSFLYLGRGIHYPIALEGALKLKEISYIHAEGYPAGELKHGPIALVDAQTPTVVLAPNDPLYAKIFSQLEQVKARGGPVLAVGHAEDALLAAKADACLTIPKTHELLTPVLSVLPLQLLAYTIARQRGLDVDQPRNLAKSVTVE